MCVVLYRETEKRLTIPTQELVLFASCLSPTKENLCLNFRCIKKSEMYYPNQTFWGNVGKGLNVFNNILYST